jgi:DnaJ-domain-containing protein 1
MSYRLTTKQTWAATLADLRETFRKWGVVVWAIDAQLSGAKAQRWNQSQSERRVELSFTLRGSEVALVMDRQDRAVDNLRVLYLAVEAMRLNDARGIAEVVASAYAQLPPPGGPETVAPAPLATEPCAVLGIAPSAPLAVAEAAYRTLVKAAHPDAGGDAAAMQRLNAAIATIREQKGGT